MSAHELRMLFTSWKKNAPEENIVFMYAGEIDPLGLRSGHLATAYSICCFRFTSEAYICCCANEFTPRLP